jgi:hypothetical protein
LLHQWGTVSVDAKPTRQAADDRLTAAGDPDRWAAGTETDGSATKEVRGRWWCTVQGNGRWLKLGQGGTPVARAAWGNWCGNAKHWRSRCFPAGPFALVVMLTQCLVPLLSGDAMTPSAMRRPCSGLWPSLHSEARGKATLPQLGWTRAVPDDMCLSCTPVETYPRLTTPH